MGKKLSFLTLGALFGIIAVCLAVGVRSLSPSENRGGRCVLKLAHGLDAGHPVHIAMLEFKKDVEKMSGGELSIDIYGGAVLGGETQCLEQLRNGSLDMTKASAAQIGTFVPEMYLLTLPYLYDDSAHYWKVLDSATGEKFFSFLRGGGFVGLCYYDAGARCFYSSKKRIEKPEDLAGMKIRVMNSRADMEMAASFGASPTVVSAAETYTSLAQGLVDGAENNLPTYLTSAHCEVAKYFTKDEHTRIPDVLLINEKSWNSLTQKQREILKNAAIKSSLFQRELWKKAEDSAEEELKKKGVEFIRADKNSFRAKTARILARYRGRDAEIVNEILEAKKK